MQQQIAKRLGFTPEVVYFSGCWNRNLRLAVMAAEHYDLPMLVLHMDDWMAVEGEGMRGPRWGNLSGHRRIVEQMTRAAERSLASTSNSPRLAAKAHRHDGEAPRRGQQLLPGSDDRVRRRSSPIRNRTQWGAGHHLRRRHEPAPAGRSAEDPGERRRRAERGGHPGRAPHLHAVGVRTGGQFRRDAGCRDLQGAGRPSRSGRGLSTLGLPWSPPSRIASRTSRSSGIRSRRSSRISSAPGNPSSRWAIPTGTCTITCRTTAAASRFRSTSTSPARPYQGAPSNGSSHLPSRTRARPDWLHAIARSGSARTTSTLMAQASRQAVGLDDSCCADGRSVLLSVVARLWLGDPTDGGWVPLAETEDDCATARRCLRVTTASI